MENCFDSLIGSQLGSVEFVQDYVQFHFDGPWLQAITHPSVRAGDRVFTWNDNGYRDQLCYRIARIVVSTSFIERQHLEIIFDDGTSFFISLRPEDYRTAEAVIFNGRDGWWIY
jgi:hypothetical protein